MVEITEGVLKSLLLLDTLLRSREELSEAGSAVHSWPHGKKVSERPTLLVEQLRVFIAARERTPLIEEFGQRYGCPILQYCQCILVFGRRANVGMVSLKTGIGVELRQPFVQPGWKPVKIEVQKRMHILVVYDGKLVPGDLVGADRVEAHHGVRLLPGMKVNTGRFGAAVPQEFRHQSFCGGLILRRQDEKRRGRIQTISGKLAGENSPHLLKLPGHVAPSSFTAVRHHAEVGTANLAPRSLFGERRSAEHDYHE